MDNTLARSVFTGLAPERLPADPSGPPRSMNSTMPILLASTMAVTMTVTPATDAIAARATHSPEGMRIGSATVARALLQTTVLPAPAAYHVVSGDTIDSIAARYGLSAPSVRALNGLSSSSAIFAGQILTLLPVAPIAAAAPPAPEPAAPTAAPAHPAPKPAASKPSPASGTVYLIRSGDTLSEIAARFGVSLQALLDANDLTRSSPIYAGTSLLIPGTGTSTAPAPPPAAPPAAPPAPAGVTLLNAEQSANAVTIISVGRQLGVPDYGIIIALATAMQESSMHNLDHGHLDSVGLFQQRPSSGWGTVAQLTTPTYAAKLFYGGPSNPNKGKTRGLLDISGWQSMTLTQAAQKVQVSAYPNAYAKWEASARYWFSVLQ